LITFTKMQIKNKSCYSVIVCTILMVMANAVHLHAQKKTVPLKDSLVSSAVWVPKYDLEQELVPLDEIIALAIENSPYIKYDMTLISREKYSLRMTKMDWLGRVSATGMYSVGNQQVGYGTLDQGTVTSTSILNGYRYGFNVNIPLSELTSRGPRVRAGKLDVEAAKLRREQTEFNLRRQVIQEYNSLVGAEKLLKIRSEGRENARLTYQMAEKQFREGGIQLGDMTKANDALMNAESVHQMAITEYKIMFLNFEELIGVKLSTLKRAK
jgi:outer membrane protein TolC